MIVDVFLFYRLSCAQVSHIFDTHTLCFSPSQLCSAYNIFFKEERQKIMTQEHKSLGFENLAKTIGARWKRMLNDEEKAPYEEMAAVSFSL